MTPATYIFVLLALDLCHGGHFFDVVWCSGGVGQHRSATPIGPPDTPTCISHVILRSFAIFLIMCSHTFTCCHFPYPYRPGPWSTPVIPTSPHGKLQERLPSFVPIASLLETLVPTCYFLQISSHYLVLFHLDISTGLRMVLHSSSRTPIHSPQTSFPSSLSTITSALSYANSTSMDSARSSLIPSSSPMTMTRV